VRPSELLGVKRKQDYLAYCLDQAIGYLGDTVTREIDEATAGVENPHERQRKASMVLEKYFSDDKKPPKGHFADPALLFPKT
jgi:hypothetical protein